MKQKNCSLAQNLKKIALLKGNFTLSSGKISKFYFDKYRFETQPELLKAIAKKINSRIKAEKLNFDLLAGCELGGIPLACALSLLLNKPFIIVRKEKKKYGTKNFIEGILKKNSKVILLEDVVTTGKQALEAIKKIESAGGSVVKIISIIDRQEGRHNALKNFNYSFLFQKSDFF